MIVTITIPDELYQAYAAFNASNPRQAIQKQLERFKNVPTNERVLLISGEERKAIEALHGTPIESAEVLQKWLEDLTGLKIGDDVIPLREGQRKRLTTEAGFYRQTPADHIRSRVKKAIDDQLGAY